MREIEFTRWFYWTLCGFVCVCKLGGSLAGEMNVNFMVVGGGWLVEVRVRVRWETEGFVWKLCDSCHQHA